MVRIVSVANLGNDFGDYEDSAVDGIDYTDVRKDEGIIVRATDSKVVAEPKPAKKMCLGRKITTRSV